MRTIITFSIILTLSLCLAARAENTTKTHEGKEPIKLSLNGKIGLKDDQKMLFTFEDLKNNNKLIGISEGKQYKVTQFRFSCGSLKYVRIPVNLFIKSDSFSQDHLNFLRTLPDGVGIMLHDVHLLSPDSVEIKYDNCDFGQLMKDSTSLLIAKYGGYLKAESDVRIKLIGNPTLKDIETVDRIIHEVNSCLSGVKFKRVSYLPSVIISFDTTSKALNTEGVYVNYVMEKMEWGYNPFFPKLTKVSLGINPKIYNQQARDSILWSQLVTCAFFPWRDGIQQDLFIGRNPENGLSHEGKSAIQTIFKNNSKVKELWLEPTKLPSVKFLFLIFLSMVSFLILKELFGYYGFIRNPKYKIISHIIFALVFVQVIIILMFLIDKNWLERFHVSDYERFFCPFAVLTSIFIWFSAQITNYLKYKWLKLACNPLFTFISLYLAYQTIYLFVRFEVLRWETIDINAMTIAVGFICIRFFTEYQSQKMVTLMQEKEFELTKHKELQNRAELNALQARINPHFLYNALNSIAELIHIDEKRTEKMVLSLSKLFQYNVNREGKVTTTLAEEIEMVKVYLEIEKQRLGDRLNFKINIDNNLLDKEIPRFLIQPLVENAIKHGISNITKQGEIILVGYEKNERFVIEIYDNGPDFPEGINTGYGLQNTYEKLNIIYKKPYEIKFVNTPKKYLQIVL